MDSQTDDFRDDDDFYYCIDEEFFDDNEILEVCEKCSKVRIASCIWAELDEHVLEFFLKIKNEHIWTMCPPCLTEQFEEVKKCQKS